MVSIIYLLFIFALAALFMEATVLCLPKGSARLRFKNRIWMIWMVAIVISTFLLWSIWKIPRFAVVLWMWIMAVAYAAVSGQRR
ncbi:hypothetical protein [Iodobacter fluviatilis]|uniref:Uncharacterized protein n=1 Tax=Iodobacter fluviatilis TaxID=537 RepID=A0A377QA91_9NEIS|nr:hypothetical protein [Iodobacter fluviatilis]TCU82425.1 hypothetical protein EV682_11564 [Iodobacter fluviatilis]STQ91650.1 Uncharacterised protein [Iodobacter fluviatilis]